MNNRILKFTLVLGTILLSTTGIKAQEQSASPAATTAGKVGGANVTITYSSPSVKGRQIWGGLVPYDKAWRAGANKATVLMTDKDIQLEGQTLKAGSYSLFAVPGQQEWKVILNSETGQWGIKRGGEANRDPAKDVMTLTVKPEKNAMTEKLTYEVANDAIILKWENLQVPIKAKG
ncbi:DUF2911 domain-containing protein [Flavihumibacter solisilvae]|uniref:Asparagine synthetase B n=1 Tax=Flavihumibacter solisilvae TaxID=1349421 RepID=A0A0C1LHW8_9BACT|nr:DUF2911 domain-containing protein [Flavihumibacter solisilvae]KIC94973.1 hypothetical protein OI18_08755 [Flavihumibacter solisilvae]